MTKHYSIFAADIGGWSVRAGMRGATEIFATKTAAIERARQLAGSAGAEIVVHGRDGAVESRTVFPRGYGALRDAFAARPGIDLTQPIYEQVKRARPNG